MEPVYLEESVPPNVSSPFASSLSEPASGRNETPRTSEEIVLCERRLFVNVGTVATPLMADVVRNNSGSARNGTHETLFSVRSIGPNPMMPSTWEKPVLLEATPIDW